MSIQSKLIGIAKQTKKGIKGLIEVSNTPMIYPVRRINGIMTKERICAMTFDDGPFALNPNPAHYDGPLTLCILETLEKHNAKGTFDCIGDTSSNYPDECGEEGTAMWGGKAYDHYPDFKMDHYAGIQNCPDLVNRILEGNHEITSHSYVHRIWGKKPIVYHNRQYFGNIADVVNDLETFDRIMRSRYNYAPKLGRPPHYVDRIDNKFTSYDAYAALGYQYLGAGPDGGGWLPLSTYEDEVEAMVKAIRNPLENNPNAFCGSIIFQKDGYNMSRRTPVADALEQQLTELDRYGYRVITVSELMEESEFSDLGKYDEGYEICKKLLQKHMCPAFTDNKVHLEKSPTKDELAMVIFGWEAVKEKIKDNAKLGAAYKYALKFAKQYNIDLDDILLRSKNRLEAYTIISELKKETD